MSGDHNGSSRRLVLVSGTKAKPLALAIRAFLATEASGGVALFGAAVLALIWANLAADSYHQVWTTEFAVRLGPLFLREDPRLDQRRTDVDLLLCSGA